MSFQQENLSDSDLINELLFLADSLKIAAALINSDFKVIWANDNFINKESKIADLNLSQEWDIPVEIFNLRKVTSPAGNEYQIIHNRSTNNILLFSIPIVNITNDKKDIKKIAHDLSNILTNTLNSADLLKLRLGEENYNNQIVESIINNTIRSSEMIDALCADDYEMIHQKYPVNIYNLIRGLHQSISNSLPANINFHIESKAPAVNIICNSSEIYRVLLNLCTNAIEAMPDGGDLKIIIDTYNIEEGNRYKLDEGEYAFLEIVDTGIGIPKNNLPKVFDLNFSTKDRISERGFGLNIVKEIIAEHKGFIDVESEENAGTKFRLLLPVEKKITTEEFSGDNKKILIAEDESHLLELLNELLSSFNFNVIKAVNGEEVLSLFSENTDLSLLIIDKKMPLISGTECVEKIRITNKDIPIIIASGSRGTSESRFIHDPNTRFLKKPYNFDQLIAVVQELIG